MKFEAIIPALREGKMVRRSCWPSEWYMSFIKEPDDDGKMLYACDDIDFNHYYAFSKKDFNADDWEIVEEDDDYDFDWNADADRDDLEDDEFDDDWEEC